MTENRAQRSARTAFGSAMQLFRNAVAKSGPGQIPRLASEFFLRSPAGQRLMMRLSGPARVHAREYRKSLPPGYPARHATVRISIPQLPPSPFLEFSDHPLEESGRGSKTVLATARGGFMVSEDCATSWRRIELKHHAAHEILHVRSIGRSEFLVQAILPQWKLAERYVDTLVVGAAGDVLAANRIAGSPWHGCRAVDMQGETLMFAEYPYESGGERRSCRVFRSRDRGRSWDIVFASDHVRHFHFLQARPGYPGEWWLTSGDEPRESRVWVSRDDGDSWQDVSQPQSETVRVDGVPYPRTVFRLTDLAWDGATAIWGTDHYMPSRNREPRGARVLQSPCEDTLAPSLVATVRWPIRNLVEVGDFYFLLSQGPNNLGASAAERRPGVFLMPRRAPPSGPGLVHLFDVEAYSAVPTGFTYSKASRARAYGVFFTSRSGTDVFPFGHKLLKWEVIFFLTGRQSRCAHSGSSTGWPKWKPWK